ncbi:UNVERIFIED_CONTAM: hypothetical protein K2H54_012062 [Gekko kuhli]
MELALRDRSGWEKVSTWRLVVRETHWVGSQGSVLPQWRLPPKQGAPLAQGAPEESPIGTNHLPSLFFWGGVRLKSSLTGVASAAFHIPSWRFYAFISAICFPLTFSTGGPQGVLQQ